MRISLTDAGKRFNRDWIFRHFNYEFQAGRSYAIIGPNGSGKSTLLQLLSGGMIFSEGKGQWSQEDGQTVIDNENIYKYVSIAAPYLEVVEEMTIKEFFAFHHHFKPFLSSLTIDDIILRMELNEARDKQIRNYSSGMKQRVRLAQAIFSDVPVLLLDEPCTNLDASGIKLYHELIQEFCTDRLLIISSNDGVEYSFCKNVINLQDHKK